MKRVYEAIAETINKRPFLIAGIVIAVLIVCMYGASLTTMKTGSDTYLDKTQPFGSLVDHYEKEFGSDSVIIIIEGDDMRDPEIIDYIESLEDDISNERYVSSVSGLPDILKLVNGGVLPHSKVDIDSAVDQIPDEYKKMYLPSNMMTLVLVPLEPSTPEDAYGTILKNFRSIAVFVDIPPGVTVTVSGSPAFSVEMKEDMGNSTGTLIMLAMVLMVVAMALLFGHVRYRFLPVLVVFCGIIMTFGVMGLAGIPLSMVVVAAFPVLIGIGIDYAIQIQSRIDEDVREMPLREAIKETVTNTGPAVLLAMIATALGFFALMVLAPSPMVADFGKICIIGIFCCYISALIIIPTFVRIIKYAPKGHTDNVLDDAESCQLDWQGCDHTPHSEKEYGKGNFMAQYDRFLGKVAGKIAKNPVVVVLICLTLAVTGMQLDSQIIINTDEDAMVPQGMPAKLDMDKITRTIGSTSTITLFIHADDILDPPTLKWMDGFSGYVINRQDDITGATSIATYLKIFNNGVLPLDKNSISELMEKIPLETRDRYLSGNSQAVIEFSMKDISIPATELLIDDMQKDLEWYNAHPGISASYTGTMAMFSHIIKGIRDSKDIMTYFGFALILGFLVVVYRKFTAISPIIPIVMIVGWNSLIMYLMGLDYTLLTATLGAMTIGIASEYTILIMERYQEERSKGMDMEGAIQRSVQKIGTAVTVSGLTTVFGFSALIMSTSPIISNFGTVTVVTVAFSLIGAILVMPAVIAIMDRFEKNPSGRTR